MRGCPMVDNSQSSTASTSLWKRRSFCGRLLYQGYAYA